MKRTILAMMAVALAASLVGAAGCTPPQQIKLTGQTSTHTTAVSTEVSEVRLSSGTLVIKPGRPSLTYSYDSALGPYIVTKTSGSTLRLGLDSGGGEFDLGDDAGKAVTWELQLPELTRLEVSGGSAEASDVARVEKLVIRSSGPGAVVVKGVEAADLDCDISGPGNVTATGDVESERVRLSGPGDFLGGELHSVNSDVAISGPGGAEVWATGLLDFNLSSGGGLRYWGEPAVIRGKTSGSGKVESLGKKPVP